MVKIVGITGSLRNSSYTFQALEAATARVEALGTEVEILDLRQMHFNTARLRKYSYRERVIRNSQ